jgi:hypothetical protein
MAPTLKDFNNKGASTQELRMNAFQPTSQPSPAANSPTINTIASHGALLDPEGKTDSVYNSITSQLSYSSSSSTLNSILTKWNENDVAGTMESLREVLVSPDIPDEQKQEILYNFQHGQNIKPLSYNVGISALMSDDIENGEQEDMRIKLSQAYNDVNQYNAWSQTAMNALNSESDIGFITHLQSFINSMIPFTDAAGQAMFENALKAGDENPVQTLLLLGEGRERLRETLLNTPIEERKSIIQNMIGLIKTTQGSLANDTVTLQQIQNLERMIVPGAYNNTERWLDNIFSVLDATILLSPVRRIGQSFRGAVGAADEARVAGEVMERAERSASGVEPLPRNQSLAIIPEESKAIPMADWTSDVDNIVDSLPIEPTSSQIGGLRKAINDQLNNPNGFNIDEVINNSEVVDSLNSTQIIDLRQSLGSIRDKRTIYLEQSVPKPVATIGEVRGKHVSSNVQPTSVAMNFKDTNVSKAKAVHQLMVADDTGRGANIAYGTTRDNALAHDYLPEIGGNGRVSNKVEYNDVGNPDNTILKHIKDSETTSWADKSEKAAVQKAVIDDWKNVVGLSNRSAMASIENLKPSAELTDNGVRLNQIYGPENGGFSNAYTGIDIVRSALRKYGVADNELTVLARQSDGTYAPANRSHDFSNGDFLIQVKYDYNVSPRDVEFTGFDVSPLWGFLQIPDIRFLNREGGIVQQLLPKSVNIDPRAFVPGIAATDRASGIQRQFLREGKEFANRWKKLDKVQQGKVDEYIRKANAEEIVFSMANLRSLGINEEGIDVVSRWKTLQDTLYTLENMDVARGLKDRGYQMLEHRNSGTRLIVEPAGKTTIPNNAEIYDAATDSFIILSQKNIDDLYQRGGQIVKPRNEYELQGRNIEYILAENNGTGAFSRTIRDDDKILNYRHGYYHVKYTDPYYVTKYDPKTKKTSTIARSEGSRDARIEVQRLNDTKDGFEYSYKRDNAEESFDNHVDVATHSGRSAQRLRGKQLERVGGSSDKTLSDAGIESPIDSLTRSISSISHRTSFRNVIDAERRRWMSQFKHLVPSGPGGKQFPDSVERILDGEGANEARHAFRHVEQLSDGYANTIDEFSKGFFNTVSEVAGNRGWGWVDKMAAKASRVSPSAMARLTAFKLFLAANPIRQLPLQALPAIPVMASLNPLGIGKVFKQLGILGAWHRGIDLTVTDKIAKYGLNMKETRDMLEAYELSGVSAAVNAHSYLADDMARLADRNMGQRAMSLIGKPLRIAQSVGFDLGEQSLMSMIWLSEYDRLTRKLGRTKLTGTERDNLMGKVRALTGDMNRGGDMPYNSNSFSVLMQFLQTPHKISSGLILGHRGLTSSERARVAAGYTVAFGVPGIPFINQFVDKILPPDNPEARDIVKGGMTNAMLNSFLTSLSGESTRVDVSGSVQPFTLDPMVEFIGGLLTMSVQDTITDSAAISLIAEDGRINRFVRAVTDWITPGSYENVDEAKQVYLTFLQMFSGLSNTMKAKQILEAGKITTAQGQTVDEDVSFMEALMKAAGFQTLDEVYHWAGNTAKWEIDGSIQKDIETLVDDLFLKYTREGVDPAEMEQYTAILRAASSTFNSNPAILEKVSDYYKMKMRADPQALYRIMLTSGLYTKDDVIKVMNNSNWSVEQRRTIMEMYDISENAYGN